LPYSNTLQRRLVVVSARITASICAWVTGREPSVNPKTDAGVATLAS
jgi:hypothetical protein